MTAPAAPRLVASADGVHLAVYETGRSDGPTVVLLHGYPDDHTVWDGLVGLLADRFQVVTYDVRGAGASDKPRSVGAYRMPHLLDDLRSVIEATAGEQPVHLLAHDWGSVQAWAAVTDDRLAPRIATFTSISGPSLDYSGAWIRRFREHPGASLRQLLHSSYVGLFQVPRLPELAIRRGVLDRALARTGAQRPRPESDEINGLQLYRANLPGRLGRPRPVPADLPVQVVVPEQDPFITPRFAVEAPRPWVQDLTVRRLAGGHWIVSEQPELVAALVTEFVTADRVSPKP